MLLVYLNYNFEFDWFVELSDNKLSDNNLASELVGNGSFLNQSQLRKLLFLWLSELLKKKDVVDFCNRCTKYKIENIYKEDIKWFHTTVNCTTLRCTLVYIWWFFFSLWIAICSSFTTLSFSRPESEGQPPWCHQNFPFKLGSLRSTTRLQRPRHKICILNWQKQKFCTPFTCFFLIPCISFEFSANLRLEMTISQVLQRTWTLRRKFEYSFLALTPHL